MWKLVPESAYQSADSWFRQQEEQVQVMSISVTLTEVGANATAAACRGLLGLLHRPLFKSSLVLCVSLCDHAFGKICIVT